MMTKIVMLCVLVLGACGSDAGPDATYSTRGKIEAIGDKLDIHHEPIPTYKDRGGKQIGMASMTMSFAVAKGVSIANLTSGSKIAFTFDVRWTRDPGLEITSLSVLPPETELELGGM